MWYDIYELFFFHDCPRVRAYIKGKEHSEIVLTISAFSYNSETAINQSPKQTQLD